LNTGISSNTTLMNNACDDALKVAILRHPFRDAVTTRGWDITSAQDYVSISAADSASGTDVVHNVLTARIIDTSASGYGYLKMKDRQWWDRNVVYGEDNQTGWPDYGMRDGDNVYFERPVEANRQLLLRCVSFQTFSSDATECPVKSLDVYVERFVTSRVFRSVEQNEKAMVWKMEAEEAFMLAKEADPDIAEYRQMEGMAAGVTGEGTAITNQTSGMATYGETHVWYND
jgi:hypothetical protein